jgi:hypothetical protein
MIRNIIFNNTIYGNSSDVINVKNRKVFRGKNGLNELAKSITLKVLHKKRIIIGVDQGIKFCTICNTMKKKSKFTNITNEKLCKMSDLFNYIFTACNDCSSLLENVVSYIYGQCLINNDEIICPTRIVNLTLDSVKITKNRIYLENYFIIKCMFNKDITKYIFLFVEPPTIHYKKTEL